MASLGDISRTPRVTTPAGARISIPSYTGNAGKTRAVTLPIFKHGGWLTWVKAPTSVIVNLPGTNASDLVALFSYASGFVENSRPTAGGNAFYDLDNGTYRAYALTRNAAWEIVVVGQVVTVTALSSSGGEPMFGGVG